MQHDDLQRQQIKEMLAKELRVTDKGLDPDSVMTFLEKAKGSSKGAARLLEQFASLQKASTHMQAMIAETSQLADQVKKQVMQESEGAKKQLIEAAKQRAKEIISEARSSCTASIEETNSTLLHIKNKLEETLDQATKRCLASVESTNLVFLEAVTMAKEMQEMAFQKAKEMALINMGAIREEIHNVVEATQRELNSALGQLTGGEGGEPHLAADKEPQETELISGRRDAPPTGPIHPVEPSDGLAPLESSEPHFDIRAEEDEEMELKRSEVFPQAEEADMPSAEAPPDTDFGIGAEEDEEMELKRSEVFPQAEEADMPSAEVPPDTDFGIGAEEDEEMELRRSEDFPQVEEVDMPSAEVPPDTDFDFRVEEDEEMELRGSEDFPQTAEADIPSAADVPQGPEPQRILNTLDYLDSDQNTLDELPVMNRSGLEIEEGKQPDSGERQPSADNEDASRLYNGEVILVIPQGARQSWIRGLRKRLLSTPNVYIRLESGGDESETMLTLLLTTPVDLGSLLLTVPSVKMVAESGNGREPSPKLKKRHEGEALSGRQRTLLRLVLDDGAVSNPPSQGLADANGADTE